MYALAQAMRAIRANWVASVSTITTMTLSLTMLAALSLASANLSQVLANLQGELEVAVYLAPEANDEQLIATIRAWPEVDAVQYVRSDQALADLVADLPALSRAASFVENPLPDTLHVRLIDPSLTQTVRFRLEQLPGVDEVDDASQAVDTFLAVYDALRVGGSILVVVLLSAALFAIVNSIRAAITGRRDEIDVMRLVGATRSFIRAPFLWEGVLLGVISATISLGLVIPGYQFGVAHEGDEGELLREACDPAVLGWIAGALAALAVLVGFVGSAIGLSQFLRERR
jgi:cell division transport system permease protein